jgi:hypothetical protein
MNATIHDVAKAANVSPSTVSRAFTMPDLLRADTRERVVAAAQRLGYQPNRAARGLITGRTGNVGVIVPDRSNPFFPAVLKGRPGACTRIRLRNFPGKRLLITLLVVPMVGLYYSVFAAGIRAQQSVDAMAVIYTLFMPILLVVALRFINPTQLVTRVREQEVR